MTYQGHLHKMHSQHEQPLIYQLNLSGQILNLSECVGKNLTINYLQQISCIHCGRDTSKSFSQGYCYPCFKSLAQCDLCIMSPEKCHFHLGTCREPEWGVAHCMKPHIVYLSNTSGVKVGITRETQIPTRWVDQGAIEAMPILRVSKRYFSGLIETAFKNYLNDKTNWRTMLRHEVESTDLFEVFESHWPSVAAQLSDELRNDVEILASREAIYRFDYPSVSYPQKIMSFNLDKNARVEGCLNAVKGQYLIFDTGVINIRKFAGYLVSIEVC